MGKGKVEQKYKRLLQEEDRQKQELLDWENQGEQKKAKLAQTQKEKRDMGLQYFTKEKRRDIVVRAKRCAYSAEDIKKMEYYQEETHWNQDEVEAEGGILKTFQEVEEFLKKNEQSPSKVKNLLSDLGKIFGEDDEGGGAENDN